MLKAGTDYGDITSKVSKVLIGYYSFCKRKESMTVNDSTIQAEGLSDFFKNLGKKVLNVSKKLAKKSLKQTNKSFRYYSKPCYCSC